MGVNTTDVGYAAGGRVKGTWEGGMLGTLRVPKGEYMACVAFGPVSSTCEPGMGCWLVASSS